LLQQCYIQAVQCETVCHLHTHVQLITQLCVGAGPGPRSCDASSRSRHGVLSLFMCSTAATGSWSSSGTGFTTAGAHVCASLVGQCHQPAHWGSGGGHSATAPEQGGQGGGREHTWRHADCSQEQHPQSHGNKAQASVSLNYFRVLCGVACTAQLHRDAASGTHVTARLSMHRWTF